MWLCSNKALFTDTKLLISCNFHTMKYYSSLTSFSSIKKCKYYFELMGCKKGSGPYLGPWAIACWSLNSMIQIIIFLPSGKLPQLFSTFTVWRLVYKFKDVHGSVKMSTWQTHTNSCFMFISSKYPYFDDSHSQCFNSFSNFIL